MATVWICLPNPKSLGFQWKKASLDVRSPCLLRLTAGLKQTFVTKHCRFVPIDTSFTLAWDKFDLCKQFLWNQSNESSDSRNQIRQHFCTLLFCSLLHIFQEKQCMQHKFLHAIIIFYKKMWLNITAKKSLLC